MKYRPLFLLFLFSLSAGMYAQTQAEIIVPGADGREAFRFTANTADPDMRRVPQAVVSQKQKNTREFIRLLAEYITEKSGSDFDRVKKAHDWVALNIRYDAHAFLSGRYASQDYDTVLRRGLAVCAGYAETFKTLCGALGIECETVAGYARGVGRNPFGKEDVSDINHDWNIVIIEGKKYLVDCTWDSGHLNGRSFRARYRTAHLFADPSSFVNYHFPANPAAQLLDPPVSAEAFTKLPFVDPGFAQALEKTPPLEKVTEVNAGEDFIFEFPVKEGCELIYGWYTARGARLGRADIFPGRLDVYRINLPNLKPGNYILRIWARRSGSQSNAGYAEYGILVNNFHQTPSGT